MIVDEKALLRLHFSTIDESIVLDSIDASASVVGCGVVAIAVFFLISGWSSKAQFAGFHPRSMIALLAFSMLPNDAGQHLFRRGITYSLRIDNGRIPLSLM